MRPDGELDSRPLLPAGSTKQPTQNIPGLGCAQTDSRGWAGGPPNRARRRDDQARHGQPYAGGPPTTREGHRSGRRTDTFLNPPLPNVRPGRANGPPPRAHGRRGTGARPKRPRARPALRACGIAERRRASTSSGATPRFVPDHPLPRRFAAAARSAQCTRPSCWASGHPPGLEGTRPDPVGRTLRTARAPSTELPPGARRPGQRRLRESGRPTMTTSTRASSHQANLRDPDEGTGGCGPAARRVPPRRTSGLQSSLRTPSGLHHQPESAGNPSCSSTPVTSSMRSPASFWWNPRCGQPAPSRPSACPSGRVSFSDGPASDQDFFEQTPARARLHRSRAPRGAP